ncbi:hypothetical protein OSTOST_12619 [Ostertagia ostertagi]
MDPKNYVEKEAKGEVKQNAWCEQVERAIEFVKDPRLRDQALCRMAWKAIADEAEKVKKEQELQKATEKVRHCMVKKLRKAVVNAYKEAIGDEEGAEELFEKEDETKEKLKSQTRPLSHARIAENKH